MASEQRGADFTRQAASNDDAALNTALPSRPTSQAPAQSASAAGSSGQGSSLAPNNQSTSIAAADIRPQVNAPEHIPSPSAMEQGFGGFPPSTSRPEVMRISTGGSQGLGAGLPIPPANAQSPPRPRSGYSAHSQGADPFAGSPDRSPAHSNEGNSQRSRSHGSLAPSASGAAHASPAGPVRYDANEGYGTRLRHALEAERDNVVQRLTSTQPQTDQQAIGSQMRHLFDDERDRLVERIPGAYVQDPQNPQRSPSGRLREAIAEERGILVDHIPGGSPHGHPQGQPQNEGFGSRLRHAAEDYFHETFPTYRLPAIPGRIFNPSSGARGQDRNGQSVIDHVVPISHPDENEKGHFPYAAGSVSARLSATLNDAQSERDKYASKAKFTGLALNVAIGLQVLLGSLTTGLSAVATQGKSAAVSTTILGALSTVVASYLARARGSNEPELSITRVKDLEQFIRECKNFENDHGDDITTAYDDEIEHLRSKFESLLGNANGERKLSPTGGALTR